MQIKASEFTELNLKEMKTWNDSGHICRLTLSWKAPSTKIRSGYFWNRPRAKPVYPLAEALGWFSNRTGTSVDDGKARGKDWTRLPVLNLLLCHWSSQLFDLRASSSTDVPVLLLNQPTIFLKPLSGVVSDPVYTNPGRKLCSFNN